MPLSRITVTVPENVVQAADELARALDRSRSWVVAEAIRRFVSGGSQSASSGRYAGSVQEPGVAQGGEGGSRLSGFPAGCV